MWFLTKLWAPWWLLFGLSATAEVKHYSLQQRGPLGIFVFGYGGIAMLITLVYACTRAFRRASSDSGTRR